MLFHRGVHHHQAVMTGGEAVHLLRVRVGRAEVAQAQGRVASLVAHLLLMTTGVTEDGATMTMIGVHLVVNLARVAVALANRVRAVALHHQMMTIGVTEDGVTMMIGEALLVANLGRVVVARVRVERVARHQAVATTIGILRVLRENGNTMNG